MKKSRFWLFFAVFSALLFLFFASYVAYNKIYTVPTPLSSEKAAELEAYFFAQHQIDLHVLTYPVPKAPRVYAKSAIIIDASNGTVLYEKNADEPIPPASLAKLMVMYIVFEELAAGNVSLSDVVPLPRESWAVNAPPQSSLMYLGKDHIVTLNELLLGLAVSSGNDAAVAVAFYISGSVPRFVERMNAEARKLNLKTTHFVEPSGYDENNITTARDFAAFCKVYLQKYSYSLQKYHSASKIAYPLEHNMPQELKNRFLTRTQFATNRLLELLEGCDGLKTGFIYESGYNIALTAMRNGTRFISITLGGPGRNTYEGNLYRVADGKALYEWAFKNFSTVKAEKKTVIPMQVWGGKTNAVNLVEVMPKNITVPEFLRSDFSEITYEAEIPSFLRAPIPAGTEYGKIRYKMGDFILAEIPLASDRTVEKGNFAKIALDNAAQKFVR